MTVSKENNENDEISLAERSDITPSNQSALLGLKGMAESLWGVMREAPRSSMLDQGLQESSEQRQRCCQTYSHLFG